MCVCPSVNLVLASISCQRVVILRFLGDDEALRHAADPSWRPQVAGKCCTVCERTVPVQDFTAEMSILLRAVSAFSGVHALPVILDSITTPLKSKQITKRLSSVPSYEHLDAMRGSGRMHTSPFWLAFVYGKAANFVESIRTKPAHFTLTPHGRAFLGKFPVRISHVTRFDCFGISLWISVSFTVV